VVSRLKRTRYPKKKVATPQIARLSAREKLADALKRRTHHARFKRAMRHEIANLLTHDIGAGLAIAGMAFLIVKGVIIGDPWRTVSSNLFGASRIFLNMASSFYHALWHPKIKQILRSMDHSAIFFAIAGTIFYSMGRLPYHHMMWHLFVLTGSMLHFLCIYLYV
jgi:predicted membrane channel-forming protein YqfA (hemolysin III family)